VRLCSIKSTIPNKKIRVHDKIYAKLSDNILLLNNLNE
jgi:hypothetical protein